MIILYHGSGSRSFELLDEAMPRERVEELLLNMRQLLRARGENKAADLLRIIPFSVVAGTNDFNDPFSVLYARVPLPQYEELRGCSSDPTARAAFEKIAEVASEIGRYIRFIAIDLARVKVGEWDLFLCHASEDKESIADPLFACLESAGIRCWYDRGEILWGDSIVEKVQEGLRSSRFVIVILTAPFVGKRWPTKELNAVLSAEIESGKTRVLPLIAGTKEERESIRKALVLHQDKRYLQWTGDPQVILDELRALVVREGATTAGVLDRLAPGLPKGNRQGPTFESEFWPEEGRPQFRPRRSRLVLRGRPTVEAPVVREIDIVVGSRLDFSAFRYRTLRPGVATARSAGSLHGRSFGNASYISSEMYYGTHAQYRDYPFQLGDVIEYLQYRAEGSGFLRLKDEVLDVSLPWLEKNSPLQLSEDPACEGWLQLVDLNNRPIGWLLIDESVEEIGRTF